MSHSLISIAVPGTPRKYFTYDLPDHFPRLKPGQRCIVPFGRRRIVGFFINETVEAPPKNIKSIIDLPEPEPLFPDELFKFLLWMSDYYLTNNADVLLAALPPELRRPAKPNYVPGSSFEDSQNSGDIPPNIIKSISTKGFITFRQLNIWEQKSPGIINSMINKKALQVSFSTGKESKSENVLSELFPYIKPREEIASIVPNNEQASIIREVTAANSNFVPYLIYGITGSGKTLAYCHIAREILNKGKSVLVMVPEIALAGTVLSYFKSFFKDEPIALLHSALKKKDRLQIWQNVRAGKYRLVIGARSSIFAPLKDLGLIIVDEEHDESYKQDDPSPRFQGRDCAVMRAKMAGVPVILGSASPSIESFYNARSGRYRLLQLTRRPEATELPVVRLVDLKEEYLTEDKLFFTSTMISKIRRSLESRHQIILYLNRRGFSPRIKCTDCGHTPICPHCELHLTYHRAGNKLMCHFCGFIQADYNKCISCGGNNFIYIGTGTQKIEDKISVLFPDAKMVRLDSDSAAARERAHIILSEFARGTFNILLGTQMVTKGIDFPNVSLVGVLMADIGMDMPDFRASEKLFAKLIQVAGRSGRGIIPGEVVIQTFNPDTDLIDDAARQDFETFYSREVRSRKELNYPPFSHIVNFRFSSRKEEDAQKYSLEFKNRLVKGINENRMKVEVLGPAPCPLYRLRGLYRRHLFIKTGQITRFAKFLGAWEEKEPNYSLPSRIKLVIDIDPYDMM